MCVIRSPGHTDRITLASLNTAFFVQLQNNCNSNVSPHVVNVQGFYTHFTASYKCWMHFWRSLSPTCRTTTSTAAAQPQLCSSWVVKSPGWWLCWHTSRFYLLLFWAAGRMLYKKYLHLHWLNRSQTPEATASCSSLQGTVYPERGGGFVVRNSYGGNDTSQELIKCSLPNAPLGIIKLDSISQSGSYKRRSCPQVTCTSQVLPSGKFW